MNLILFSLLKYSPYIFFLFVLLSTGVSTLLYARAKKQFSDWNCEDEDVGARIEKTTDLAMVSTSVCAVLSYFFFALPFCFPKELQASGCFLIFLDFVFCLIVITILQKKLTDLSKQLYPEKHFNFFDEKFQEKIYIQSDEAEKALIGAASRFSYKKTQSACFIVLFLLALGNLYFDIGILPIAVVIVIWLVSQISYFSYIIKTSYR